MTQGVRCGNETAVFCSQHVQDGRQDEYRPVRSDDLPSEEDDDEFGQVRKYRPVMDCVIQDLCQSLLEIDSLKCKYQWHIMSLVADFPKKFLFSLFVRDSAY